MPGPQPVVVVTGASAGIGRATALAFGRCGWSVALIARGLERLESAARDVERCGGRALAIPADVADAEALEAAAAHVAKVFGTIDVWINNAMVTLYGPIAELTAEEIRRVTEVTYLGQVHGTLAALKHMRPRNSGTIVQVGSALAYRAIPLQSAYCAAKFAVRGFTDALRSELLHEGSSVRLTMVQLPAVDTPQFDWARSRMKRRLQPVPPIHDPGPVADAILRAALDAPRELWVGSPTVKAILGSFAMPGVLDRLAARQAWSGQMSNEVARPRPDNLYDAPSGDPGVRGRFGAQSRPQVWSVSETATRIGLGAAGLGLAAGIAGLAFRLGARKRPVREIGRSLSRNRAGQELT